MKNVTCSNYPNGQELTMTLVDQLVSLVSFMQIEKHNSDVMMKKQFTKLYDDLRASLTQAYDEIDSLRAGGSSDNDYKRQCEKLTARIQEMSAELQAHRDIRPPPNELHTGMERELDAKKSELARELENGMQRDFEIRRLMVQSEVMMKELEATKRAAMAKDREIQQRFVEDKDLEKKMLALQGVLDQSLAEAAQFKDLSEKLQEQLEKANALSAETEKIRSADSTVIEQFRSRVRDLEQQLQFGEAELQRKVKENQAMVRESETSLREASEANVVLQERLRERALADEISASKQQLVSFRVGDICEAAIISAHNLPGSEDTSTTMILSLDHRHQVQQTRRASGRHPVFDEDFVCKLTAAAELFTIDIYQQQSPADAPSELLGCCRVSVSDFPVAPGREVELVIQDEKGDPVKVNGTKCTVKLFLARSNPNRSGRRADATVDPAEMQRLTEEIKTARLAIDKLENELQSAKDEADGLRQQLQASESGLGEAQRELADLESTLRKRQSQESQAESRARLLEEKNSLLQSETDKLRSSLAIKEQVLTDLQAELVETKSFADGLRRQVKSSEEMIEGERREIEADESTIARLEKQVQDLQKELTASCKACDQKNAHMAELTSKLQKMIHELSLMEANSKKSKQEAESARLAANALREEKNDHLHQISGYVAHQTYHGHKNMGIVSLAVMILAITEVKSTYGDPRENLTKMLFADCRRRTRK